MFKPPLVVEWGNMKKKLALLFTAMVMLIAVAAVIIVAINPKAKNGISREDTKIHVLTTFYPIYMIGLNLADQIDNIEVKSLTDLNTGCLHDYQLTTQDMRSIAAADILVINGGGMESFLEDVVSNYPNLKVIDASQGINKLPNEVWEIGGKEVIATGDNSHVWLDPKLYVQQIENVREGLLDYIGGLEPASKELAQSVEDNAQTYIQKVQELDTEIEENFKIDTSSTDNNSKDNKVIIFHNAFAYLANRIGLTVTYTVPLDSDTALSAGEIAKIIDVIREDKIKYLFTEQQYGDSIANRIESETDAKVYTINSAVTGDGSKDSYLTAMKNNLQILKEALR